MWRSLQKHFNIIRLNHHVYHFIGSMQAASPPPFFSKTLIKNFTSQQLNFKLHPSFWKHVKIEVKKKGINDETEDILSFSLSPTPPRIRIFKASSLWFFFCLSRINSWVCRPPPITFKNKATCLQCKKKMYLLRDLEKFKSKNIQIIWQFSGRLCAIRRFGWIRFKVRGQRTDRKTEMTGK